MKNFTARLMVLGLCIFLYATLALGVPTGHESKDAVLLRNRRDMKGVFDSLGEGFTGFIGGMQKVGNSIKAAFAGVFSSENHKSMKEGYDKLKKGVQGAWNDVNNHVKNGVKKVKEKIKNAFDKFKGKGGNNEKQAKVMPTTEEPEKEKSVTPAGEVPEGETTQAESN